MSIETQNGSHLTKTITWEEYQAELSRLESLVKAEQARINGLPAPVTVLDEPDDFEDEDDEPQPETDRTAWYIVNRLVPILLPIAFVGLTFWGLSSLPSDDKPADPGLSCFGTGDAKCGPAEPYQAPTNPVIGEG